MSQKRWNHGYHQGKENGFWEGFSSGEESGRDRGESLGKYSLAREMWYLIDEISKAAEEGNIEKRWTMIGIAKSVLSKYYEPPSGA